MAGIVDSGRSFLNSLPIAGGIFEGLFGSPEQEAHARELARVKAAYEAYRPEMQANRFGAMQNQSAAFGPMQQLMGQMYGPGAQMDFSKIVQNPFANSQNPKMRR